MGAGRSAYGEGGGLLTGFLGWGLPGGDSRGPGTSTQPPPIPARQRGFLRQARRLAETTAWHPRTRS